VRHTDICIVGAGPAGLSVAMGLVGSGLSVVVLEAGAGAAGELGVLPAVQLDDQDPYPHGNVDHSHAAGVGGTAGLWSFQMLAAGDREAVSRAGCRYAPLQPLDFTARPAVNTPGWDLDPDDLQHWYGAAQGLAGIGPYRYDVDSWTSPNGPQPLPLHGSGVVTSMFQFGPASAWTIDARARLEAAAEVSMLTGCCAIRLERNGEGNIVGVHAATGRGNPELIRARAVVLAAGGLETVRILLDTARHDGRPAPGNRPDLVGRYFMEHPLVRGGLLVTEPSRRLIDDLALYGTRKVGGTYVSAKLTLDDETVQREGLLATSALLVPRDTSLAGPGALALARMRSPSGRRDPPSVKFRNSLTVFGGGVGVCRAVLATRHQPTIDRADWAGGVTRPRWTVFELIHQTEQSPHSDNQFYLDDQVDEFGRSRLRVRWRWALADRKKVAHARDLYAAALERAGIGRLVGTDYDAGLPRLLGGTHHHMGVTRLSADPEAGVVDPQCRVHDTSNLYVAGSAVFPSGGFVNPTLTVVAMALRLSAHLRSELGSTPRPVSTKGVHS
jgi:choline dehydrogenase-like flavoprotein